MKTSFARQCSLGLAACLTFFLGCAHPSAEPPQPRAMIDPTPATYVAQAAPGPADPAYDAGPAPDNNPPAIVERIPGTPRPDNVPLSPGLAEVAKLAQAGVGEDVILAYVEKYPGAFNVG